MACVFTEIGDQRGMAEEVNVLVIEDEPAAAAFLENILRQAGCKVWVVDEPKRGLELARETPLAVVLTELHGRMNGVEVTKAMGKLSVETSVVVIAAASLINSAVQAMEAGAYGYVTKPFNSAEVRIVVQRAAEHYLLLSADSDKRRFAELSVKDALTDVYNHRYFTMYLDRKLATIKFETEHLSLLMIDLDNFKQYNDTQGHLAGDALLRNLGKILRESLRQGDIVCRYGGEEFVVLLNQTNKPGAALVAERLRTLANLYTSATVSIGVSTAPDDGRAREPLVARADEALYQAKRAGKNRVCIT